MAQYSNLKAYIEEKIYENGTQAITGDILQDVLKVMTDDLGEFYQTGGVASPSTDPGTPDAKVIYFATEAGTYTNFGGITLAAGEVALLIFETSWTKVELNVLSSANGGVKTANLADGAVTTEKIAGGAVETAKIANNAVTSGKVADGAIGTAKIADGAIGADKIAANAVESAKIKNGAVTEGKINDGAVTADKVAANAVTTAKIADDAVTTAKLNDGAVTEDKIATDAVTSGKVKDGAIGTAKIAAGAVTHAKIGAGAVEESNIKDGAVTSDKIADGAVGSDQLAEGAFSAQNLADGSVTTDKLADEAVTAEKIADGAVTADKFANGSVTTIKLGSGAVTTEKIGDGMVTRQKLADSSVGTSKIIDGAVTTDKVADGAITDAKLENPVSVSQNSETGHTDITIGSTTTPVASVGEVSRLAQKQADDAKTFIRLQQNGKIVASPSIWFHNTANCEVILKIKMPSSISAVGFFLSWQGGDGASYLYVDAQNIMYVYWEGTRRTYFDISDYLGKDVEIRLVRYGGSAGNLLYLYINGEQKWAYNANSVGYSGYVYIGSYIESYASNLVSDYYYLYIRNLDTQETEVFNANSSFVELAADKYVCGEQLASSSTKFEDYINNKGIISGNLTISSAVVLPANTHLRGENCKVTVVGNNASITLQDGCSLEGFDFDGDASYTRQSKTEAHPDINPEYRYDLVPVVSVNDIARIGTAFGVKSLVILDGRNASVINCTFENFYNVYSCIKTIASDSTTYNGTKQNSVINCHFNDGFLAIDNRSEFSRIIGCEFKNFAFGLYAYAGNLNLSACHFVRNDIGVVVANSGNGGHSQYNGCEWAHNGVFGLYAESLPTRLGLCISGGQFADAPIGGLLGGLCITGSRIDSWFSFQFATATGTCNMIHDCIFDLTTLSRDYPPSEYGVPGYLDYYFQLAEGCTLDLKNNVSLNPQYLPNTILNN